MHLQRSTTRALELKLELARVARREVARAERAIAVGALDRGRLALSGSGLGLGLGLGLGRGRG